jgi:methionine synthase II (cobalamin-independent)
MMSEKPADIRPGRTLRVFRRSNLDRSRPARAGLLDSGEIAPNVLSVDLSRYKIETPEAVAARIRSALPYVGADHLIVAPDCRLKYLPRDVAFEKICAMVEGTRLVECSHVA